MQSIEAAFMRTLRQLYDTEKQLSVSLSRICVPELEPALARLIRQIEVQSKVQAKRLEGLFAVLYLTPRTEAAWPATAMLREAWNAATEFEGEPSTEGCAASLLALKRYELSLYESLYCWSRGALSMNHCPVCGAALRKKCCNRRHFRSSPSAFPKCKTHQNCASIEQCVTRAGTIQGT